MFDLFGAYLLIIILLLSGNIGLFLSDLKLSKIQYILTSVIIFIVIFLLTFFSSIFKSSLSFLNGNFGWIFIIMTLILIIVNYVYIKKKNSLKIFTATVIAILFAVTFLMSCQITDLEFYYNILFSVVCLVVLIILIPIADLMHYAKREYYVVVGEFISLEAILIFIFGLTFWSVKQLNYEMFSSFLILTPTYQLIYILIALIFILIVGVYYNDKKLKKR